MKTKQQKLLRLAVVFSGALAVLSGCAGSQWGKNIVNAHIAGGGPAYEEFARDFNEFFVGKSEQHFLDAFWPNRDRADGSKPGIERKTYIITGAPILRYFWQPIHGMDFSPCNLYVSVDDGVVTELGLRTTKGGYMNVGSCESALDRMARYKAINDITPDYYYDKEK